ncbi:hypothetical protein ACFU5O_20445 [Streptomyces sp. NPDC057445]
MVLECADGDAIAEVARCMRISANTVCPRRRLETPGAIATFVR